MESKTVNLLCYLQPEDYEPPFFKCCADNEAINIWNKNPLKMEVGNVNSKHLVLALKVVDYGDSSRLDQETSVFSIKLIATYVFILYAGQECP